MGINMLAMSVELAGVLEGIDPTGIADNLVLSEEALKEQKRLREGEGGFMKVGSSVFLPEEIQVKVDAAAKNYPHMSRWEFVTSRLFDMWKNGDFEKQKRVHRIFTYSDEDPFIRHSYAKTVYSDGREEYSKITGNKGVYTSVLIKDNDKATVLKESDLWAKDYYLNRSDLQVEFMEWCNR